VSKENQPSLVLGSGTQGSIWAWLRKDRPIIIDNDENVVHGLKLLNFTVGDALYLPLADSSIGKIYADFLLNAIQAGKFIPEDVIEQPEILLSYPFPKLIRDWYRDTLQSSFDKERDLIKVRWLLRTAVLQEMWRVIAVGGEIIIVDRAHIINWVENETPTILQVNSRAIDITPSDFDEDDLGRSGSLIGVCRKNEPVRKICLRKTS
jgi:hypothetical protein